MRSQEIGARAGRGLGMLMAGLVFALGACDDDSDSGGSKDSAADDRREDDGEGDAGEDGAESGEDNTGERDDDTTNQDAASNASKEHDGSSDPRDAGSTEPAASDAGESGRELDDACHPHVDGSRLRRVGYLGADGSWWGSRWFDDQLGAECEIGLASDGVKRCMPTPNGPADTQGELYLDADCTRVVYRGRQDPCADDVPPPRYSASSEREDESECAPHVYRAWEVGERIEADELYTLSSTGECAAYAAQPEDWPPLYAAGPELTPDMFVAVENEEPVGDRIQMVRSRMSDGSEYTLPWSFDTAMQTRCAPTRTSDGQLRCAPIPYTVVGYTDPECSDAVTQVGVVRCPSAGLELFGSEITYPYRDYGDCTQVVTHFFEPPDPDAALTPEEFYRVSEGDNLTCAGPYDSTPLSVAPPGPEIAPDSFVAGTLAVGPCAPDMVGGSRIAVRRIAWEDGSLSNYGFFDTELGVRCQPSEAEGGTTRCVPVTGNSNYNRFADAACSVPVVAIYCPSDDPSLGERDYLTESVRESDDICAARYVQVKRLIGPELQTAYSVDAFGECVIADEVSTTVLYREIGDLIPAEEFVEFTDWR